MRDGKLAVEMLHKALACDLRILFEEPKKTLITMAAAYFLYLFPTRFYMQLEQVAMNFAKGF